MTVAYAKRPVDATVRAVADRVPGVDGHLRTVAIIDAHQTFCDLLQLAVGQTADLTCVAAATTVDDGLAVVRQLRPDVVVVGLEFPTTTVTASTSPRTSPETTPTSGSSC